MISHTFDPYLTPHSHFFIAQSSCVPWKNMEAQLKGITDWSKSNNIGVGALVVFVVGWPVPWACLIVLLDQWVSLCSRLRSWPIYTDLYTHSTGQLMTCMKKDVKTQQMHPPQCIPIYCNPLRPPMHFNFFSLALLKAKLLTSSIMFSCKS